MTKRSISVGGPRARARTAPFLILTGLALAGGAFGCTRGSGQIAQTPVHPTSSGAAPASANYVPAQDATRTSDTTERIKGFENDLEPPDAKGGGPAYESDVGEPQWRGSSGSFAEDPARGKKSAPHTQTPNPETVR